ncbi:MFS transporter [Actinomadura sp. KC345]|nr:MFS transporter [Actinomadura sp. KC345]
MPRVVWLLIAARAVNRLGAFSLSFLTVLVTAGLGGSPAAAGAISAAFGIATIPSRLVGGRLADRFGRRRTIVGGLLGCAVAQAGIAGSGNLAVVACFAVLLGLVFELYEPPSQAIIADAVGRADRVRAYSLLNAALAAAGMGAGLLAAGLGRWDLRWLFVADAVTCLVCALVMRIGLPADRSVGLAAAEQALKRTGSLFPWCDRVLLALFASGTLFALLYLQIMTILPLALTHRGLRPADAGLLFTASALTIVAGQPLLRLTPMTGAAAFTAGYLLLAAGLAGYAAAHTLPVLLVATVLWSLGDLLLMGRMYAAVADIAPPGATGRYMAVYGTSWGIGAVAAPLLGTQILQHAGATALWTAMTAVCLALAALQPALARAVTARAVHTAPAAITDRDRPSPDPREPNISSS